MRQLQLGALLRMRILLFGQCFIGGNSFGHLFQANVDLGKIEQVFDTVAVIGELLSKLEERGLGGIEPAAKLLDVPHQAERCRRIAATRHALSRRGDALQCGIVLLQLEIGAGPPIGIARFAIAAIEQLEHFGISFLPPQRVGKKEGRLAFGGLVRFGAEHTARLLLRQRKKPVVEGGLDIG